MLVTPAVVRLLALRVFTTRVMCATMRRQNKCCCRDAQSPHRIESSRWSLDGKLSLVIEGSRWMLASQSKRHSNKEETTQSKQTTR